MKLIFLLPLLILFVGCDQVMKEAYAPTNPPKTPKKDFNSKMILGSFVTSGQPNMFLWRVNNCDEEGLSCIPMSLDEKAESRKNISLYRKQLKFLELQARKKIEEIVISYTPKKTEVDSRFTAKACYSYCNTDDPLCDPSDDSVLEVDEWMCSEDSDPPAGEGVCADEVLLQNIFNCQAIQSEKEDLVEEESQKVTLALVPVQETTTKMLNEIGGDRNIFSDLRSVQVNYNPIDSNPVEITISYYNMIFSNDGVDGHLPVNNIHLDLTDGFLTFDISAIDIPSSTAVEGMLSFDLEFRFVDGRVSLDGDIILRRPGQEERVGRLSAPGMIIN